MHIEQDDNSCGQLAQPLFRQTNPQAYNNFLRMRMHLLSSLASPLGVFRCFCTGERSNISQQILVCDCVVMLSKVEECLVFYDFELDYIQTIHFSSRSSMNILWREANVSLFLTGIQGIVYPRTALCVYIFTVLSLAFYKAQTEKLYTSTTVAMHYRQNTTA